MKYTLKIFFIISILIYIDYYLMYTATKSSQIHNKKDRSKAYETIKEKINNYLFPTTLTDIIKGGAAVSKSCLIKFNLNIKAYELGDKAVTFDICKFYIKHSLYNNKIIDQKLFKKLNKIFFENINYLNKNQQIEILANLLYVENSNNKKIIPLIKQLFLLNPYENAFDSGLRTNLVYLFFFNTYKKASVTFSNKMRVNNAKNLLISFYFDNFNTYKKELYDLLIILKDCTEKDEKIYDDLDGMLSLYYINNNEINKAKEILIKYDELDLENSMYLTYSYLILKDNFLDLDEMDMDYLKDFNYEYNLEYYKYLPRDLRKEILIYLSNEEHKDKKGLSKKGKNNLKIKIEKQKIYKSNLAILNRSDIENKELRMKELSIVKDKSFSYESNETIGNGMLKMYDNNGSTIFETKLEGYKFLNTTFKDPEKMLEVSPLLPLLGYYNEREVYKLLTGSSLIKLYSHFPFPQVLEYLLKEDSLDIELESPMILSSSLGHRDNVKVFLRYGVKANAKNPTTGYTALQYAVSGNHIDTAKLLLKNGANVHILNESNMSLLIYSSSSGMENLLVEYGLKIKEKELLNILHLSIKEKNYKFLSNILKKFSTEDIHKHYNEYLESTYTHTWDKNIILEFYKYNVDLSKKIGKSSVLSLIVSQLSFDKLRPILEKENKFYPELLSSAFINSDKSRFELLNYLIKKGLSFNDNNLKNIHNSHTTHNKYNHYEIIKLNSNFEKDITFLIKNNANLYNTEFIASLYLYVNEHENYNLFKYLISKNKSILDMYINNETLLSIAIHNSDIKFIKFMIKNGANIYNVDKDKNSALMKAVIYESDSLIKYFSDNYDFDFDYKNMNKLDLYDIVENKDLKYKNKYKMILYPYLYMIKNIQKQQKKILQNLDNDIFQIVKNYKNKSSNFQNAFKVYNNIDINSRNINGDTLLHYAVKYTDDKTIRWIMKEYEFSIDTENYHNKSTRKYFEKKMDKFINSYNEFDNIFKKEIQFFYKIGIELNKKHIKILQKNGNNKLFKWLMQEFNVKGLKLKKTKINEKIKQKLKANIYDNNAVLVPIYEKKIDLQKYKHSYSWIKANDHDKSNAKCKNSEYTMKRDEAYKITLYKKDIGTNNKAKIKDFFSNEDFDFYYNSNIQCNDSLMTTYIVTYNKDAIIMYDILKDEMYKYPTYLRGVNSTFTLYPYRFFVKKDHSIDYINSQTKEINNMKFDFINFDFYDRLYVSYDKKYLKIDKEGQNVYYFKFSENNYKTNKSFLEIKDAIENNNIKKVKKLISNGHDVNIEDNKITPILMATYLNNIEIGKFLLQKGAKFNYKARDNIIKNKNLNFLKLLIKNIKNKKENNYIAKEASHVGSLDIMKYYFHGISQDTKDDALSIALRKNHEDIVEYLIENGADINKDRSNFGYIAEHNNIKLAKRFISHQKFNDLNKLDKLLETAVYNSLEITKLLINAGASTNKRYLNSNSNILDLAIGGGNSNIVKFLLSKGIKYTQNAPYVAINSNNKDMFDFIIKNGAKVTYKTFNYVKNQSMIKIIKQNINKFDTNNILYHKALCRIYVENNSLKKYQNSCNIYANSILTENSTWYYLLGGKFDKVIKYSKTLGKNISSSTYSNIAHSYLIKDMIPEATRYYELYFEKVNYRNSWMKDINKDFKVLSKLYPKKFDKTKAQKILDSIVKEKYLNDNPAHKAFLIGNYKLAERFYTNYFKKHDLTTIKSYFYNLKQQFPDKFDKIKAKIMMDKIIKRDERINKIRNGGK